jgi:peptidoglycan/LPS O-acetylase OafA/YrhL
LSTSERRLSYRPDIEGLRALAILIVVLCHAGVPHFAGGFVGVDIFFVLSGFLITGLLVSELAATGRVDFLDFYARRFRRLLPALLLMLIGTSALAILLLAPYQQIAQAEAAVAVPMWLSNMHFAWRELDYFGGGAESQWFLHTWSLAVEEQFYLIWPLMLFAAWRMAKAAESRSSRLEQALLVVLLVSFAASVLLGHRDSELAFYSVLTRAWQFSLGGLLFLRGSWLLGLLSNPSASLRFPPQALSAFLTGVDARLRPRRELPGRLGAAAVIGRGDAHPRRASRSLGPWSNAAVQGGAMVGSDLLQLVSLALASDDCSANIGSRWGLAVTSVGGPGSVGNRRSVVSLDRTADTSVGAAAEDAA